MPLSSSQQDGLSQILQAMEKNSLTPADVKKAYTDNRKQKSATEGDTGHLSKSELILRLFAYLGGTLVFAGLGVFIETIWDQIGSLPRVVITFGSGFTAYLCGLIFISDARFRKIATPANVIAFILQPVGLFVLLNEYAKGDNAALGSMIVFGPLMLQQALTFLKFRAPSQLLFSLLYLIGFSGAAVEYFDMDRGFASLAFGLFLLLVTINMQIKSRFKDLTPVFFIIGTMLFFGGVYYFVGRTVYDVIALALILSLLGFAVLKESKTLYVLSVLYMGAYYCGLPGGGWAYGDVLFTHKLAAMFTGASLVLTGHWLSRSHYISLYPVWMFVGTCLSLGGFFGLTHQTAIEPLSIALSAGAIYLALLLRSRAVLAASVLSTIGFIVSYTAEHFANTVGWPILLIIIGLLILASGFMFARLAGRIKSTIPA
jgi:hypothetical protein